MAQAGAFRVAHTEISLRFGSERVVEYCFSQSRRTWDVLRNATIETGRTHSADGD